MKVIVGNKEIEVSFLEDYRYFALDPIYVYKANNTSYKSVVLAEYEVDATPEIFTAFGEFVGITGSCSEVEEIVRKAA